ncbi:antirestriction protein [Escherichia coli]|nr:antirestriction protein [Escherichia coli]
MNNEVITTATKIIDPETRLMFLPKHFGQYCMTVEDLAFNWMRKLSPKNDSQYLSHALDKIEAHYTGGEWDFFELSNGGVFLSPTDREKYRITVAGNYFDDLLSAEAAGIVVTFFTLGQLSALPVMFSERCAAYYHKLYDYAREHEEYVKIRAAID